MISTKQKTFHKQNETSSGCYTSFYSFTTSAENISENATITNQKEYTCSFSSDLSSLEFPSDMVDIKEVTIGSGAEKVLNEREISSEKVSELLGGLSNIISSQSNRYIVSLSKKDEGRILIKIILPTAKIGQKIQLLEDCNNLIWSLADQFENKSEKINFQSSFFVEITETKNGSTI